MAEASKRNAERMDESEAVSLAVRQRFRGPAGEVAFSFHAQDIAFHQHYHFAGHLGIALGILGRLHGDQRGLAAETSDGGIDPDDIEVRHFDIRDVAEGIQLFSKSESARLIRTAVTPGG